MYQGQKSNDLVKVSNTRHILGETERAQNHVVSYAGFEDWPTGQDF